MHQLITNADDFGLTPGVNQAVVELHQAGALSSTTLMATSAFFLEAVKLAAQHPTLRVGCHVVLVDGQPLSPPSEISSLLDFSSPTPAFRATLGHFVRDLYLGRIQARHIQIEAAAQIRHLQTHGVAVTHFDTHKHTHMFPRVLAPVLQAAQTCGVPCVRNPFEPAWSTRRTPQASPLRRLEVQLLRGLRSRFLAETRAAGLTTTEGSLGVLATGTLDAPTVRSLLNGLPPGTWELVCHPAYVDENLRAARTRLIDSRQTEVDALLATLSRAASVFPALPLIHFGNLAAETSPAPNHSATNLVVDASNSGN